MSPSLARAYEACASLAANHYENFPVASRLLPAPMRPHVAAVYAFARVADEDVERLEPLIDRLEQELPPLTRFILPGGAAAGGALHVARTVCRRAERRIVGLTPAADDLLIRYVNRLSDLLFVLARAVNHRAHQPETEW